MAPDDTPSIESLRRRFADLQSRFDHVYKGETATVSQTMTDLTNIPSEIEKSQEEKEIAAEPTLKAALSSSFKTVNSVNPNDAGGKGIYKIRRIPSKEPDSQLQVESQLIPVPALAPVKKPSIKSTQATAATNSNVKLVQGVMASDGGRVITKYKSNSSRKLAADIPHEDAAPVEATSVPVEDKTLAAKERIAKFAKARETQAASSNLLKSFESKLQLLMTAGAPAPSRNAGVSATKPVVAANSEFNVDLIDSLLEKVGETRRQLATAQSERILSSRRSDDEEDMVNPYSSLIAVTAGTSSISPVQRRNSTNKKTLQPRTRHSMGDEDVVSKAISGPRTRETISPIPQHESTFKLSPLRPSENPFKNLVVRKKADVTET